MKFQYHETRILEFRSREEKDRKAKGKVGNSRFLFKVKKKLNGTIKQIYCS